MTDAARSSAEAGGVEAEQLAVDGVVVGAERPAEVLDAPGRLAELGHRRLHGDRAEVGVVDPDVGAPGPQVLVGQQLLGVVHRRGGDLGRLEDRHGLVERALDDPLGHEVVDLAGALLAPDRVDVVGVVGQVGSVDGPEHPDGDAGRGARDGQPLVVGGAVGVARGAGVEAVADPAGAGAELVEGEGRRLDEPGQRLDEVDVDELPLTAVHVAVVERHHHRVGGGEGGDPVGQHERRQGGRPVGLADHVGEAAHRLGQRAVAGAVALGAAPAVAGDVQHHDVRVGGVHRLVVDAPALEGARPVADDQHVADVEQPVEQLLALGLAQVERDAALVAADALPHEADAVAAVAPRAHRVAGAGRLDLDDLGAELAERGAHHRARGEGRRFDDPQPVQRTGSAGRGDRAGRFRHGGRQGAARGPGSRAAWRRCTRCGTARGAAARARPCARRPRRRRARGWRR